MTDDAHAGILAAKRVGYRRGFIRAAIVNDDDLELRRQPLQRGDCLPQSLFDRTRHIVHW